MGASPLPPWQSYLDAAQAADQRGDLRGVVATLSQALDRWPEAADVRVRRAHFLYALRDHQAAIADYTQALRQLPQDADALGSRGMCFLETGRPAEALDDLNRALAIDPQKGSTWGVRAQTFLRLNQPEAALYDVQQAIRFRPDRADFHYLAGEVHYQLGRFREAMEAFSQSIVRDPQDSQSFSYRAACLVELGEFEAALGDANRALQLDPQNNNVRLHRAQALAGLGDKQQAFSAYSELLARDPNWFLPWRRRGELYLEAGWFQQATDDFSQVLRLKPEALQHYFLRIKSARGSGNEALVQQDLQHVDQIMRQRVREVSQRGRQVRVALIQAFIELYSSKRDENASAIVLLTFDPALQNDWPRLHELATRVGNLKGISASDPQEAAISRVLASEKSQLYRRLPVPASWTGGIPVCVADLYVHRPFLPNHTHLELEQPLMCVAEEGASGRIELLPT